MLFLIFADIVVRKREQTNISTRNLKLKVRNPFLRHHWIHSFHLSILYVLEAILVIISSKWSLWGAKRHDVHPRSYLAMYDIQSCPRCHKMMSAAMTIMTMIITTRSIALLEPGLRDFCSFDSLSPEHGEKKFFWQGHTADVILDINIYWVYLSWIFNKYVRGSCCYLFTKWDT